MDNESQSFDDDFIAIKQLAYKYDPECWVSYSGKSKKFKQAIDYRRNCALQNARIEYESSNESA